MSGGIAGRTGEGNRRVEGRSAAIFNIRAMDFAAPARARSPDFLYSPPATRPAGLRTPTGASGRRNFDPGDLRLADDAAEVHDERGSAAADGGSAPPPAAPAPTAAERAGRTSRLARAKRVGYPVALVVVVILFLFWPRSAGAGGKWEPGTDDLVFLAIVAYLARQVTKDSRVLLDLPGVVSRAVRRALRLER
jgi:hypothetical protein